MSEGVTEDLQRWTGKRVAVLVLSILRGKTSGSTTEPGTVIQRSYGSAAMVQLCLVLKSKLITTVSK